MVLFETPSGFAILTMNGVCMYRPDAMEVALFFRAWLLMRLITLVVCHGLIFYSLFFRISEQISKMVIEHDMLVPHPFPTTLCHFFQVARLQINLSSDLASLCLVCFILFFQVEGVNMNMTLLSIIGCLPVCKMTLLDVLHTPQKLFS